MTEYMRTQPSFLPITRQEMEQLGWERPDFVLVTGDAYVDHPSFGTAIIARVLANAGFKVAILPQPNWKNTQDFMRFGRPRLAFLVNSGNIDSMVNHYTAQKKPRSNDAYTPGGKAGARPDRAVIVYCNRIREAFKRAPIVIGGIEASLRRFAHYDYWDDRVRRSILTDSGANLLIYGMGERPILDIANDLQAGISIDQICHVPGTVYRTEETNAATLETFAAMIPDADAVATDKKAYNQAFLLQRQQAFDPKARALAQRNGREYIIANPPAMPLTREEMDDVYALPFSRKPHPLYTEPIPALNEVEFSITSCRGCFGSCAFCALTYHQGRVVTSRSHDSIVKEAHEMTQSSRFKGYIHDVGGPTANFRSPACARQKRGSACADKQCLHPKPCKQLDISHADYTQLLRKLRQIPNVKKVFVRSGLRYDYILYDKNPEFLYELVEHHISGQLKIAPEHIDDRVLDLMGKPSSQLYEQFIQKYQAINKKLGKEQYVVPYFMSSHPGSDLNAAIALAQYMKANRIRPEQVQDFYPTPGTLATAMFYTEMEPQTGKPVYVPKDPREKKMQRALLQYYRPEHAPFIREALNKAGRSDLVGFGKSALVGEERARYAKGHTHPTKRNASRKTNERDAQPNRKHSTPRKKRVRQKSKKKIESQ